MTLQRLLNYNTVKAVVNCGKLSKIEYMNSLKRSVLQFLGKP